MPASTRNLKPVIVYLPQDLYDKLAKDAHILNRSMSYVARDVIAASYGQVAARNTPKDYT